VALSPEERKMVIDTGLRNAQRFDTQNALSKIEEIYRRIVENNVVVRNDQPLTTAAPE
jgi:hypothetical protein